MLRRKKHSTLRHLAIWTLLLSGIGSSIPFAFAANYTAVAGSPVIVTSVSGTIPGPNHSAFVASTTQSYIRPFLGGLSLPNSTEQLGCSLPETIKTIDGKRGVQVHSSGIIAGITGVISGAIVVLQNADNVDDKMILTGGLVFDANGFASPIGDTTASSADVLCAGGLQPYERYRVTSAGNTAFGNKLGEFSGQMWLYVPRTVTPGIYPMEEMGISQGPSFTSIWNGYLAITHAGDTITVLPPPCSISTATTINFDTTSPEGRTVSAPISYQCGDVEATTVLDAYLLANAVGNTPSATELALTSAEGSQPGGVVRGYIGQGVDIDSVNCTDTANSLSFNGAFNTKLAAVSNGAAQQIPLVWQLCLKGNEAPGLATGNVWLDIGYK